MLKLKLQSFGHLMQRASSLEKTLMLGKIEGKMRSRWQRMTWLDCITNLMDMNLNKLRETVKGRKAWWTAVHGVTKCWTGGSDWITATGGIQGLWHGLASLVPGMRQALNKWGPPKKNGDPYYHHCCCNWISTQIVVTKTQTLRPKYTHTEVPGTAPPSKPLSLG